MEQGAVVPGEAHRLSGLAARELAERATAQLAATQAALDAAVAAGGDKQLETSLRDRVRALKKQASTVGAESRIHLHAVQMERREQIQALRVESKEKEATARELAMTVKLRQVEAVIAAAKGKEVAAEARKKVEEAKEQNAEEHRLRAKAAEAEDNLRLHFAAYLAGRLETYMRDVTSGNERRERVERCARAAAKRRMGLHRLEVPRFWNPTTVGLLDLTPPPRVGKRLRAKTEGGWASPDFSWVLFGRAGRAGHTGPDDPPHALRRLIERTMPGYFDVLGARYGVPAMLAECMGIMDLAFVAANYRFTQVVEAKMYRAGLVEWPPDPAWLAAKTDGGSAECVAVPVSGSARTGAGGSAAAPAGDAAAARSSGSAALAPGGGSAALSRATAGAAAPAVSRATAGDAAGARTGVSATAVSAAASAAAVTAFKASLGSAKACGKKA